MIIQLTCHEEESNKSNLKHNEIKYSINLTGGANLWNATQVRQQNWKKYTNNQKVKAKRNWILNQSIQKKISKSGIIWETHKVSYSWFHCSKQTLVASCQIGTKKTSNCWTNWILYWNTKPHFYLLQPLKCNHRP